MTTPAAAKAYEAAHVHEMEGKAPAVFNPHGKPIEELPFIYGFNNGGGSGFKSAIAISADGVVLGGHMCSSEAYMPHDLGILEGTRPDRHENSYQKHYPDGYRMEFVPGKDLEAHAGINEAIRIANEKAKEDENDED